MTSNSLTTHTADVVRVDVGDLVVGFDPESKRLPGTQRDALERWVAAWVLEKPNNIVVMAHDTHAAVPTRAARLRALRNAVERLGVRRENIKYTDRPFHLRAPSAPQRRVRDAVMLKLIDPLKDASAAHQVRAVAHCFDFAVLAD